MPKKRIYSGSSGIFNKIQPERIPFDPKSGITGLQTAEHVFIDQTGAVAAARGNVLVSAAGVYHSLLGGRDYGYVAVDKQATNEAVIHRIDIDGGVPVETQVLSGLAFGKKIDWAIDRSNTFLANGQQTLEIKDYDGLEFPAAQGVESKKEAVQLVEFFKGNPPAHIEIHNWRFYFTFKDNGRHCVGFSNWGKYGLWNRLDFWQFPERVLAIVSAGNGVYIGTESEVYFVLGPDQATTEMQKVADYPLNEHGVSNGFIDPSFMGFETSTPVKIAATETGPVILLPGGQMFNLINKVVSLSNCSSKGTIGIFDESLILQTAE